MNKLSVSVRIPAIAQRHEFLIPANMAVKEVMKLMVTILSSEYGISDSLSDLAIIDESDGNALKMDCSFSQLGIAGGAKLILF